MHGDYVSDIFNASLHSEIKKEKYYTLKRLVKQNQKSII